MSSHPPRIDPSCATIRIPDLPGVRSARAFAGARARSFVPRENEHSKPTVLIVEDDADAAAEMADVLERAEYQTLAVSAGDQAVRTVLNNHAIGIVVCDIGLPKIDGLTLSASLRQYLSADRWVEFIYVTGQGGIEEAIAAIRLRAADFLRKPIAAGDLAASVARAEQAYHLRLVELDAMRELGASPVRDRGSDHQRPDSISSPTAMYGPRSAPGTSLREPLDVIRFLRRAATIRNNLHVPVIENESAWNMLLDIADATAHDRRLSVSDVCVGSGTPHATAIRRIEELIAHGLVKREPDPVDRRRIYLVLTSAGFRAIDSYLEALIPELPEPMECAP